MCNSGIYALVRIDTGTRYIGSTNNLKNRERQHWADLRAGRHHCARLQNAFLKHGEAAFGFEVIELVAQAGDLVEAEQRWIDATSDAYNSAPAAGSVLGIKRSDETRAKLARAATGKTWTDEGRINYSRSRRNVKKQYITTDQHKANLSKALKGRVLTEAHLAKMREFRHTEESKAKVSVSKRGKPMPPRDPEHTRRQQESRRLTMALRKAIR